NIPPHNLGELVDGVVALIQNPDITTAELRQIIPGPDFPTGGQILGTRGIRDAYETGRGSITMRGVAAIETIQHRGRPDREAIIVTELPFQTNKAALIEKIADLVNDRKIDGIADIRDESDRTGMRIVIELKRDAYAQVVLNNLYKQTPIQSNFGVNMLSLVNGEPQLLGIKQMLEVFVDFRIETITRRTQYQLRKAEERDHLLQGLLVALESLDAVIAIIRGAADTATAKQELIDRFSLSEVQADAILQMQLRRLTALESEKIEREHDELQDRIADLQDILARRERILDIIETEAQSIKAAHATPRLTTIEQGLGDLDDIDLIANDQVVVMLTEQGYIKRMPISTFQAQNRATRGKAGTRMKEDDGVDHFLGCCDHDSVLFFSERGVVYSLRVYQIPTGSRTSRGTPVVQMLPIPQDEKITSIIPVSEFTDDEYLVMLTRGGYVKKTQLSAFSNIRANGLIAISLNEGDELRWVRRAHSEDSIIVGSRAGMAIHFRADDEQLRPLGRATRGVRAMSLKGKDELVGMDILPGQLVEDLVVAVNAEESEEDEAIASPDLNTNEDGTEVTEDSKPDGPWVLVITTAGLGKRVSVGQFRLQKRAGLGLRAIKFRKPGDQMAALRIVHHNDELMLVTNRGIIMRQVIDSISCQSRAATGVQVQRLDEDDAIAAVALVPNVETVAEELADATSAPPSEDSELSGENDALTDAAVSSPDLPSSESTEPDGDAMEEEES
ncbi:MAG: DNA gyrase subunit A, partial [Leptolyngbyaceae bacterium]|nr:DNA gyrase subunit A [Leptolyngbyaceae bacterium]